MANDSLTRDFAGAFGPHAQSNNARESLMARPANGGLCGGNQAPRARNTASIETRDHSAVRSRNAV